MGMTGFLTVPMLFGAELVKITPMDFLADILLWPRLIHKYRGTMTAAPGLCVTSRDHTWAMMITEANRLMPNIA